MSSQVRILALSGSLRVASLNSMLLRAAARVAPATAALRLYTGLGELPLFNPDLEAVEPPAVAALRRAIIDADALVIASPEYAHGVSSVIKNALDWMVGNESFVAKPVALFNASPRATLALDALRETLRTMSARIVDEACIAVPLLGSGLSEEQLVRDAPISATLSRSLAMLAAAADRQTSELL